MNFLFDVHAGWGCGGGGLVVWGMVVVVGGGQRVAEAGAIPHLVSLLKVNDSFAQSQVLLAPALRLQHE